jgi:hypothetical protein
LQALCNALRAAKHFCSGASGTKHLPQPALSKPQMTKASTLQDNETLGADDAFVQTEAIFAKQHLEVQNAQLQ